MVSIYDKLSQERKEGQSKGTVPPWMTTAGYQLLKEKYLGDCPTVRSRYEEIAESAGVLAQDMFGNLPEYMKRVDDEPITTWGEAFFNIMWRGWLSPSTPVLINMGTDRGTPVSCSGQVVGDSINGFYSARWETALLTKNGFGTSAYLGGIRPRGSDISVGGNSSGVAPVLKGFVQDMNDVSQGNHRRGAWAGYLEPTHDDFHEVADHLLNNPDNLNVGWLITNEFLANLSAGDKDSIAKYQKIMKIRSVTGKGYMVFVDKANELAPDTLKASGISIKASNLCTEIFLPSDENHTFTCVLSSMNAAKYDEWVNTDAVWLATVFLDCVAEEFLRKAATRRGMENAAAFTEKSRALGLGVLGFHTYIQDQGWALDSFQAHTFNTNLFYGIKNKAEEASRYMAQRDGSPLWVAEAGSDLRNATLMAVAPNMSTATICGGVSQGIEPVVANVYNQGSQAGEVERINPSLLKIMKERGVYNEATLWDIINHKGSVQQVTWLTSEEKKVFRTAFEVDQLVLIRLASVRQKYIDQGQSLNLFFDANEDPKYISQVHRVAAEDPNIKSLYYMRSQAGIQASKGEDCVACEG